MTKTKEGERKMYRECDIGIGAPARVYRTLFEIKRDLDDIKQRILEANGRLDLRQTLIGLSEECLSAANADEWIGELSRTVDDAKSAYASLSGLKIELSALCEEMRETRWAMGG